MTLFQSFGSSKTRSCGCSLPLNAGLIPLKPGKREGRAPVPHQRSALAPTSKVPTKKAPFSFCRQDQEIISATDLSHVTLKITKVTELCPSGGDAERHRPHPEISETPLLDSRRRGADGATTVDNCVSKPSVG